MDRRGLSRLLVDGVKHFTSIPTSTYLRPNVRRNAPLYNFARYFSDKPKEEVTDVDSTEPPAPVRAYPPPPSLDNFSHHPAKSVKIQTPSVAGPPKIVTLPSSMGANYGQPSTESVTTGLPPVLRTSQPTSFLSLLSVGASVGIVLLLCYSLFPKGDGKSPLNGLMNMPPAHKAADTATITERLSDVKGCDDVLDDLRELVDFLKNPDKYREMGASIPRGVLLTGPPGTGKTLSARAIAGEAGVNFLWTSASDFDEMFVGTGSKRIRELFKEAREKAPCIIFIDEIDALGNRKTPTFNTSSRSTVNALLVEMDGFGASDNIMVMAATNFGETLDEALTRPGRFDRKLTLSAPDLKGRSELFSHYVAKVRHDANIDIKRLASSMMGATGADIRTIVNNAAIRAAKHDKVCVTQAELEEAKEEWAMGVANRSREYSAESLERTAYHEGGHALVALLTEGGSSIYKATIMPRGGALGYVSFTNSDETDSYSVTFRQYMAKLDTAMGGRVAEEIVYGADQVTSGASQDLVQATNIARMMVTRFGYGQSIGKMAVNPDMPLSPEMQARVDAEVQALLEGAYERAKGLLVQNRTQLERLARGLLRYETVSATEIQQLLRGEELTRDVLPVVVNPPARKEVEGDFVTSVGVGVGAGGSGSDQSSGIGPAGKSALSKDALELIQRS